MLRPTVPPLARLRSLIPSHWHFDSANVPLYVVYFLIAFIAFAENVVILPHLSGSTQLFYRLYFLVMCPLTAAVLYAIRAVDPGIVTPPPSEPSGESTVIGVLDAFNRDPVGYLSSRVASLSPPINPAELPYYQIFIDSDGAHYKIRSQWQPPYRYVVDSPSVDSCHILTRSEEEAYFRYLNSPDHPNYARRQAAMRVYTMTPNEEKLIDMRPCDSAVPVPASGLIPTFDPAEVWKQEFCRQCSIWRPRGAYHDSESGYCIEGFDHFCGVLNASIGRNNYPLFVSFLGLTGLGAMGSLASICQWFFAAREAHSFRYTNPVFYVILFFFILFLYLSSVFLFFLYHCWLIIGELSTKQHQTKNPEHKKQHAWNSLSGGSGVLRIRVISLCLGQCLRCVPRMFRLCFVEPEFRWLTMPRKRSQGRNNFTPEARQALLYPHLAYSNRVSSAADSSHPEESQSLTSGLAQPTASNSPHSQTLSAFLSSSASSSARDPDPSSDVESSVSIAIDDASDSGQPIDGVVTRLKSSINSTNN